jgi:hypothetical protein
MMAAWRPKHVVLTYVIHVKRHPIIGISVNVVVFDGKKQILYIRISAVWHLVSMFHCVSPYSDSTLSFRSVYADNSIVTSHTPHTIDSCVSWSVNLPYFTSKISTDVCVYIYIYIYTHTHTHTHTSYSSVIFHNLQTNHKANCCFFLDIYIFL